MSYEEYGKKLLTRYGFSDGKGLGLNEDGITEQLFPITSTFDGRSVIIYKTIYSAIDRERCDLISNLTRLLKSDETRARKIFTNHGIIGITLQQLQHSK
jgi:hypothetical protein